MTARRVTTDASHSTAGHVGTRLCARSLLTAGGTRDSVPVVEADRETTPRSMKGGVNGTKEPVLSLRTETLRGEIHCRRVSKLNATHLKGIPRRNDAEFDRFLEPHMSL